MGHAGAGKAKLAFKPRGNKVLARLLSKEECRQEHRQEHKQTAGSNGEQHMAGSLQYESELV